MDSSKSPNKICTTLRALSDSPRHFPDCCLSLSTVLFSKVHEILQAIDRAENGTDGTSTVLSVGSGSGLFEAHLQSYIIDKDTNSMPRFVVEGVEVNASPGLNRYLSEGSVHIVDGTWDLCTRVASPDVKCWIFVYPRQPSLVLKYFQTFLVNSQALDSQENENLNTLAGVEQIIWLGPKSDWYDFASVFKELETIGWKDAEIMNAEECGIVEYELMVVYSGGR